MVRLKNSEFMTLLEEIRGVGVVKGTLLEHAFATLSTPDFLGKSRVFKERFLAALSDSDLDEELWAQHEEVALSGIPHAEIFRT